MGIAMVIRCIVVALMINAVLSHMGHGNSCSASDQCDQSIGAQYCLIAGMSPGCSHGVCTCEGEGLTTDYTGGRCKTKRKTQGEACSSDVECAISTGLLCNPTSWTCECTNIGSGWQNGLCTGDPNKHALGASCPINDFCVFPSSSTGIQHPHYCATLQTCACPTLYEISGTTCVSRIVAKKGASCVSETGNPSPGISGGLCNSGNNLNCSNGICDCLSPNSFYAETGPEQGSCRSAIGVVQNGDYCTSDDVCVNGNICRDCNADSRPICRTAGASSLTSGGIFAMIFSIAVSGKLISAQ